MRKKGDYHPNKTIDSSCCQTTKHEQSIRIQKNQNQSTQSTYMSGGDEEPDRGDREETAVACT
jgi:hypothetical protein